MFSDAVDTGARHLARARTASSLEAMPGDGRGLAEAGAQLMAVSPELPDSALTWKEKEALEFSVLSDLGNEVAREYGIVYRIPDGISAGYIAGGRNDLTEYNGDDSLELPLAVTYVIDTDGTVVYSFVDADYRKRADTSEVVEAVTQLAAQ